MEKNSRKIFAFRVRNKLLQFSRLPFGYLNGTAALTELLAKIIASTHDVMIHSYVDDVFIVMENVGQGLVSLSTFALIRRSVTSL